MGFFVLRLICKLYIMKTIVKLISIALGAMLMLSSCGMMAGYNGYYDYNYGNYGYNYNHERGTVQTIPNPNGIFVGSRNLQPTGTFVVGKTAYPTQLRWQNMSLVKNGMMVYVYDGSGRLLNRYDLRIKGQNISDEYSVVGLTGKQLHVEIAIYGGVGGLNAVFVNDGNRREKYSLTN